MHNGEVISSDIRKEVYELAMNKTKDVIEYISIEQHEKNIKEGGMFNCPESDSNKYIQDKVEVVFSDKYNDFTKEIILEINEIMSKVIVNQNA
jgi:tRNA A58 N-methylase Trm61